MNTREISGSLATLFGELIDGAPTSGGYMLNGGDAGILDSLDKLSAAAASATGPSGSSIAAHVDHLRYGMSLMNRWGTGENPFDGADWSTSWRQNVVSEDGWAELRAQFRNEAAHWLEVLRTPREVDEVGLNGVVGSIAHLAYHLGAIRQIDRAARGPRRRPIIVHRPSSIVHRPSSIVHRRSLASPKRVARRRVHRRAGSPKRETVECSNGARVGEEVGGGSDELGRGTKHQPAQARTDTLRARRRVPKGRPPSFSCKNPFESRTRARRAAPSGSPEGTRTHRQGTEGVMSRLSRRDFLGTSVLGGVAAGNAALPALGQAPAVLRPMPRPVVVASGNGGRFRNGGNATCVQHAFRLLTGGTDVLDALIAGVNIVELDPEDTSVGYGGLPNADGVVQLDSCCMHGPKKRAGGVAALEGVRTPSLVAKAVMEQTDHHLLVGAGAQMFARSMGFTIEPDLNTPRSRGLWLDWKRRIDPQHYLDPEKRGAAGAAAGWQMVAEGLIDPDHFYGTINCNGLSPKGEMAGVTTTSGLAWKIPGRVGDSPILGAGLYVDGEIGAAGSTGRGEANLYGLCSFLIVENMRKGMHPKDAGMEALNRIKAATIEKRLLNGRGQPNFNVSFYVLNARGEHAGVALYAGPTATYAVCGENGAEDRPIEPLLQGNPI